MQKKLVILCAMFITVLAVSGCAKNNVQNKDLRKAGDTTWDEAVPEIKPDVLQGIKNGKTYVCKAGDSTAKKIIWAQKDKIKVMTVFEIVRGQVNSIATMEIPQDGRVCRYSFDDVRSNTSLNTIEVDNYDYQISGKAKCWMRCGVVADFSFQDLYKDLNRSSCEEKSIPASMFEVPLSNCKDPMVENQMIPGLVDPAHFTQQR